MNYPKFKVGDTVVVKATTKEATVKAFRPDGKGGYNYTYRYDSGKEHTLPEWAFLSPDECVFCVIGHEAAEDGSRGLWTDGAYRKRESAVKRLEDIAHQWLDNMGDYADRYEIERGDGSFEAWHDGYYDNDHFALTVGVCELEN